MSISRAPHHPCFVADVPPSIPGNAERWPHEREYVDGQCAEVRVAGFATTSDDIIHGGDGDDSRFYGASSPV